MKTKLLVILIASYGLASAQATFQKTFGGSGQDIANSVEQTSDGGFILAGEGHLIKTDANGDTLWTKTFGWNTSFNSVQQTTDGGYVAVSSYGIIQLIKTNPSGNPIWMKSYRRFSNAFNNGALSVQQTSDGGYAFVGYTDSLGGGKRDVYMVKTDASGDTLWSKSFGGSGQDMGFSFDQTTDGGYMITGEANWVSGVGGDTYLIKTDMGGNILWAKTFGGSGQDIGYSVQQTKEGGYVIAGFTNSFGAGSSDVYLIKTDSMGIILWTKTFGGSGYEIGRSVQQTSDGGYVIAGYTSSLGVGSSAAYLIKTDSLGTKLWTKVFGGTNGGEARSVQQTNDGGYILAGTTYNVGSGGRDIYLIKTNTNGFSGCNQGVPNTIETNPITTVTNLATKVSSGGVVGTYTTQIGSGGTVTVLCGTVGMEEIIDSYSTSIYPNPNNGKFQIAINKEQTTTDNTELEIYNALGEKMYQAIVNQQQETIILNVPNGIYFMNVKTKSGTTTQKLIINK